RKEMRFLTDAGQVFGGAEAVVQIARRIWWGWPLFAFSRLPGAKPAFARLYARIAQRINWADGACRRKQPNRVLGWLPLAVLALFALNLKAVLPEWGFMWTMAFAIFFGCKWLTWREAKAGRKGLRYALVSRPHSELERRVGPATVADSGGVPRSCLVHFAHTPYLRDDD